MKRSACAAREVAACRRVDVFLFTALRLIGGKSGDLSCEQICFLIDQTDHRIGSDLLFESIFVGLVRLVRQV